MSKLLQKWQKKDIVDLCVCVCVRGLFVCGSNRVLQGISMGMRAFVTAEASKKYLFFFLLYPLELTDCDGDDIRWI